MSNNSKRKAIAPLEKLFAQNGVVIMTGGSGLFADAVTAGFRIEMPTISILRFVKIFS